MALRAPAGNSAAVVRAQKPTTPAPPGMKYVYKPRTNTWVLEPKTGAGAGAGAAPVTAPPAAPDIAPPAAPAVSSKTPEEIAAAIKAEAQSKVAMQDPTLAGKYTSDTKGLGGLGFGFAKADGSAATYNDVFGSLAPGASVDRNAFSVRDALGRVINTDLLGTDVYGGKAATDIAGTALGNSIVQARRGAASDAEQRSAGGITGGGFRNAAGEVQKQQQGAEITGLLGKLAGLEGDITSARSKTYLSALDDAASGDVGRYAPEPTPPADNPAATPKPEPAAQPAAQTALTPGPKGTFMKETDAARASGTPAQKIKKLTALLGDPKYNMTDLQKKTIKQMIVDIQKKNK